MPTQDDICKFLSIVKNAEDIYCVDRYKNRKARYSLGITLEDAEDIIRNLNFNEYYSGPEPDRDSSRSGDIWIFKPCYNNILLYVKIKIVNDNKVKIISLHEDEK